MSRRPRWYFSLRSPYSWLAYHDLAMRYPDVLAALDWVPFWEPDEQTLRRLGEAGGRFPYLPMTREKNLYILQDIRRLTAERGLPITWPVDRQPRWEVPHLAYLLAARLGRGPQFVDAVYHARWQAGRDICDPATIAELSGSLGLPAARAAAAADDPELCVDGIDALLEIHRDGVFGVPFFVHGRDKYWGIDRLSDFAARVRGSTPTAAEPVIVPMPVPAGRTADGGHAGGCG
jgi:2-hydroxychromene-2-carboxylate isomerase